MYLKGMGGVAFSSQAVWASLRASSSFSGLSRYAHSNRRKFLHRFIKKNIVFFWKRKKLETCFENFRKFSKILRSKKIDFFEIFHWHLYENEKFWDRKNRKFSISKISKIFIGNWMKIEIENFRSQKFSDANFKWL